MIMYKYINKIPVVESTRVENFVKQDMHYNNVCDMRLNVKLFVMLRCDYGIQLLIPRVTNGWLLISLGSSLHSPT